LFTVNIEKLRKEEVPMVGGKGANLGELLSMGLAVPDGYAITTEAYKHFLDSNNLVERIRSVTAELDEGADPRKLEETIRRDFERSEFPAALNEEIWQNYETITRKELVAIRSSACVEDSSSASFAGQQESFLNVSAERLMPSIKKCWNSLFTARAIVYRRQLGIGFRNIAMAVVVQRMVNSEKSGVLFTADPVTFDRDRIVIESVWGLGEGIVSGTVTPDHFVIDRNTLSIERAMISDKKYMYGRSPFTSETTRIALPPERARAQTLSKDEIIELVDLGKRVEKHFGVPQDIEWAVEGGRIYALQSRPITVLKRT